MTAPLVRILSAAGSASTGAGCACGGRGGALCRGGRGALCRGGGGHALLIASGLFSDGSGGGGGFIWGVVLEGLPVCAGAASALVLPSRPATAVATLAAPCTIAAGAVAAGNVADGAGDGTLASGVGGWALTLLVISTALSLLLLTLLVSSLLCVLAMSSTLSARGGGISGCA